MERVSMSELIARRAELIEELKRVEGAIELMKDSAGSVKIGTRRNIRNSFLCGVQVYEDQGLTRVADISSHEGYVCKEDLAHLRLEIGDDEGETWEVLEGGE